MIALPPSRRKPFRLSPPAPKRKTPPELWSWRGALHRIGPVLSLWFRPRQAHDGAPELPARYPLIGPDLFAEDTGKTAPTWRELPEEARVLLTNLMARLILDHARVDGAAPSKEVNDDL